MMVTDGISVPDGLYVERIEGGLLVWVPPDPRRTWGDPAVLPPAVAIRGAEHRGGTQLSLRRVVAPATKLNLTSATVLTAIAVGVAMWIADAWAWWTLAGLASIVWGELAVQLRVASARARTAWDALGPALGALALPEPPADGADPYRGVPGRDPLPCPDGAGSSSASGCR